MPTGLNQTQVVNEALSQIATQDRITAIGDGSPAANAAAVVYNPTVQILLRELDPDFARFTDTLVAAPGTPPYPWLYQFAYPANCLRLRQVRPVNYDVFDPQPIRANVAVATVSAVLTKVIFTNQIAALGVYTTSAVTEENWDSAFADAVVRRLANPLAMAVAGRPDFAREILAQSAQVAATAEMVDDSGYRRAG